MPEAPWQISLMRLVFNHQISVAFSQITSLIFIFPPTAALVILMRFWMLLIFFGSTTKHNEGFTHNLKPLSTRTHRYNNPYQLMWVITGMIRTTTFIPVYGAIVELFIALFASWPGTPPSCKRNCAVAVEKAAVSDIFGLVSKTVLTHGRGGFLTANMCSFQSKRGRWHSVILIRTGDVNSGWQCTVGEVTRPSTFPD